MHNDEVRKLSTKQGKTRDSPLRGFFESFIDLMKLEENEEDGTSECYENSIHEKIGYILIIISLLLPILGIIIDVICVMCIFD